MSRALDLLRTYAEDLPPSDITRLVADVRRHLEKLVKAQETSELVPIDLAALLASRLELALSSALSLSASERALVVGAARYFVSTDDVRPDTTSNTGLDDDIEVWNHVAEVLGRPDWTLTD